MSASSALLFGLFGLYDGQRVMKNDNGGSAPMYYVVYSTSVICADDSEDNSIDTELRVFCPQSTPLFTDGTVVYAYAKMFAPPNPPVLLDAVRIHPFPGDPNCIPHSQESDIEITRASDCQAGMTTPPMSLITKS